MALNQQYTWKDFLAQHPDLKAKKIKRTSEEGQKAFEAAFKKHVKEFLKTRLGAQEKALKNLVIKRDKLVKQLSAAKAKPTRARILQTKVGTEDHAIYRTQKTIDLTKAQQKNF